MSALSNEIEAINEAERYGRVTVRQRLIFRTDDDLRAKATVPLTSDEVKAVERVTVHEGHGRATYPLRRLRNVWLSPDPPCHRHRRFIR